MFLTRNLENWLWLLIGIFIGIIINFALRSVLHSIRRPELSIDTLHEHPQGQGQWYVTVRNVPRTSWPGRTKWLQRREATSCEMFIEISGEQAADTLINKGRWAGNIPYMNIGPDLPEQERRNPIDRAQDIHILNIHPTTVDDFHFGGVPHTGHFPRAGCYELILHVECKETNSKPRKVVLDFEEKAPYIPRLTDCQ